MQIPEKIFWYLISGMPPSDGCYKICLLKNFYSTSQFSTSGQSNAPSPSLSQTWKAFFSSSSISASILAFAFIAGRGILIGVFVGLYPQAKTLWQN